MLGKLKFFLLTATLLCGVACSQGGENQENTGGNNNNGGNENPSAVTEINGTVIKSGNNVFGLISEATTGKGIAGVPVTDGYSWVVTDNNGVYQMPGNRWARRIWFTIPAEYEVPVDPENGRPIFYSKSAPVSSKQNRNDWVLTPLAQPEDEFTILAIGDPQCKVAAEAERFAAEQDAAAKMALAAAIEAQGKAEAEAARAAGMIPVGLGKRILRTETAASFALSCLVYELEMNRFS